MFRLLVALVTIVCAIQSTDTTAQGHRGKSYRGARNHRSHHPSSSFGFSIGIGSYPGYGYSNFGYLDPYRFDGYGYDPYRYGSFRAPDLLDDPYFRARHRHDSHFPGRYRAPLVMRPAAPAATYESYGNTTARTDDHSADLPAVAPENLDEHLRSACQQLSQSLSTRQDGDAWMEYLAPHQVSKWMASGNAAGLRELLTHYDGVVGNPQLSHIASSSGFATTRRLLRQYVSDPR